MRSGWFNPVLPPYRSKHQIKSSLPHFTLIQAHFNLYPRQKPFSNMNDVGMIEWRQNDRHLKIHFFSTSEKPFIPPHLVILTRFLNVLSDMQWIFSMERCRSRAILAIFFTPSSPEWWSNDWMRRNECRFLNQGESLNSKITLIPSSFGHSMSISHSSHNHFNHFMIIPHSYVILVKVQFQIHPMPTLYRICLKLF